MGLFETLTIPARQVLVAATEAAAGLESHEVDAAHLLVGLLDTPSVVQPVLASYFPHRDRLVAAVGQITLRSADGGSIEALFERLEVEGGDLRYDLAGLDDTSEAASAPADAASWTVTIGVTDDPAPAWDDRP